MRMVEIGPADLQRFTRLPLMRLLSPGVLLQGMHKNKVWRGLAQYPDVTDAGAMYAIKWSAKREVLATELACSLAAQALRLPVPAGILLLAEVDQLPGLPATAASGGSRILCFGSELQWEDTTGRPRGELTIEEWTWRQVCGTAAGAQGGAWDELVANDDRNFGNVVYDGRRWWLIDHEKTLKPVAKVMRTFTEGSAREKVRDYRTPENRLAWQMKERRPNDHNMLDISVSLQAARQRLRWMASVVERWSSGHSDADTIFMMASIYLHSIDLRLPPSAQHLSERLSNPQRRALWTSSSQADPNLS